MTNKQEKENRYFCKKCKRESVATKPTEYKGCPCGESGKDFIKLTKNTMTNKTKIITIDGIEYEPVGSSAKADTFKGLKYVMCRTHSAGVFAGYLKKREGQEAVLLQARRIYYWDGAASLSQLATDGTSKPENCKFPCEVEQVELTQVIEVIPITKKAQESIKDVKIWKS